MNPEMQFARRSIARYAGRPASDLGLRERLDQDLDLSPLELVLIAIDFEEAVGIAVPIEGLASVQTVADLMRFLRRAVSRARRSEARDGVSPPRSP